MRNLRWLAAAMLLCAATSGFASTPTPDHAATQRNASTQGELTVVTHLDIARVALDRAMGLFDGYMSSSQHEPGNVSIRLLRQVNATNHFTVVEVWASRAAYDAHISSAATRSFHQQLDPLLGSPHDERLFVEEYQ